jgi:integrase
MLATSRSVVRAQTGVSPSRVQRRLVDLEPEELISLIEAAKEHSPRAHAMVLLAVSHGMRASEVTGLRSASISPAGLQVFRPTHSQKSELFY